MLVYDRAEGAEKGPCEFYAWEHVSFGIEMSDIKVILLVAKGARKRSTPATVLKSGVIGDSWCTA